MIIMKRMLSSPEMNYHKFSEIQTTLKIIYYNYHEEGGD